MKTSIFLLLSILSISISQSSQACSMSVNQLYQKNLLVAYAAGQMNVDLAKATGISIASYSQSFSGAVGPADCPTHLNTQARISVSYKPNIFTKCSFSVTVHKAEQVGDVLAPGPFIAITTELPVSGCSLLPIPHPFPAE